MGKLRDLWSADGGTRAVNAPQPVRLARGWDVSPEVLPAKPMAPRRRKYVHAKPNKRDAVPAPHPGQSYNPLDDDHQTALRIATKKLEKKKKEDEKFVAMMTRGRDTIPSGNFSADNTWEEEVQEQKPKKKPAKSDKTKKKEEKNKKRKKLTKKESLQATRHSLPHRRHPRREVTVREAEKLDELLEKHAKEQERRDSARARRCEARRAGQQVKNFGRYHHTPLVLDVAPTTKLVGSLRHMNGGFVHPAMERMKSLEERNLVPARMRHKYNKRKILKPKGEVRVKRETFGVLPETSF